MMELRTRAGVEDREYSSHFIVFKMRYPMQSASAAFLLASSVSAHPKPHHGNAVKLNIPPTAFNASILHTNSFASFSFEPAFWVEFFGNKSDPNPLTFGLLNRIIEHGGQPIIRPGGITMDSMVRCG